MGGGPNPHQAPEAHQDLPGATETPGAPQEANVAPSVETLPQARVHPTNPKARSVPRKYELTKNRAQSVSAREIRTENCRWATQATAQEVGWKRLERKQQSEE